MKPSNSISSRNLSNRPGSVRSTGGAAFFASKSSPCPAAQGAKARSSQNCSVRAAPNPSNAPARNNTIASSVAGEHRRQKSDKDPNGRHASIRPRSLSDNPLIMHSGTLISCSGAVPGAETNEDVAPCFRSFCCPVTPRPHPPRAASEAPNFQLVPPTPQAKGKIERAHG